LESRYLYFAILGGSLLVPFLLSFDRKVQYYRRWKYLFPAMIPPALLYIAWDMYFTDQKVWDFNPRFITGYRIGNLPVEEVLFFFVVPYCCMFIYECIRVYFRNLKQQERDDLILKVMSVLLLLTGIVFFNRMYTSWTFILCGLFIQLIYFFRQFFRHFDATLFIISYSVILVPFLIVNGLLTSVPVVIYNHTENLDLRIWTIPIEDAFYGMLLILMNVVIYERLKSRRRTRTTRTGANEELPNPHHRRHRSKR